MHGRLCHTTACRARHGARASASAVVGWGAAAQLMPRSGRRGGPGRSVLAARVHAKPAGDGETETLQYMAATGVRAGIRSTSARLRVITILLYVYTIIRKDQKGGSTTDSV